MIDGNHYIQVVKHYFSFLTTEFHFHLHKEEIIGNAFYNIQYKDSTRIISISYENIQDYLLVTVFMLKDGRMPNYDDKSKTLHLNKLNAQILSKINNTEINANNEFFSKYEVKNKFDKQVLKTAKELRICLKHFNEI